MAKIKRNDTVKVIAGKDNGKTGRVLLVFSKEGRALVEGVNLIKRHTRKTQKDPQGGIVTKERPVDMSNLLLVCKACNRPTRVGHTKLSDGTSARFCKRCKEII